MAKTVMALYDELSDAQAAIDDLVAAGIPRDAISIAVNDASGEYGRFLQRNPDFDDLRPADGAGFGAIVGALIGLGVSLIPGIGPIIGAGPLAAALTAGIGAAAGAITGGITAGLIDMGVDEAEAGHYAEGIRRGGTLVMANIDDGMIARVEDILNRHEAVDIDHRAGFWRGLGWTGFSPHDRPFTTDEIIRDRQAYRDYTASNIPARTQGYQTIDDQRIPEAGDDMYIEGERLNSREGQV